MNFVMKEILVQSDIVSVLLDLNIFYQLYIYKTFTNTGIYIKNVINSM